MPDPAAERVRGVRHVQIGEASGQRIDNFLLGEMDGVPRSRVYGMLRKGEVRVNGGRVKPDYRLSTGDTVRIPPWHGPIAGTPTPPNRNLLDRLAKRVIYQDANIIVVDKPAGTAVHGGSGIEHGVIEAFRALLPEERNLELAHRLDRDTSGCLLLAKHRTALLELHAAFRDATVAKTYDVIVHGKWPRKLRTVRAHLEKYVTRSGERRVRVVPEGKPARTEFSIVESADQCDLGEGRTRTRGGHTRSECTVRCPIIPWWATKSTLRSGSWPNHARQACNVSVCMRVRCRFRSQARCAASMPRCLKISKRRGVC